MAKSLNKKFTLATIAGFLVSSIVFLALFLAFYQGELEKEKAQAAHDVNLLFQSSLENAMLKRDLDGLKTIIARLGEQDHITAVMIINPLGQVRFSNRKDLEGKNLAVTMLEDRRARSLFIRNEQGKEILRSINPVRNRPPCQVCHGSMDEHPINGILIVDHDAASIRRQARNTTLILMGAGALIVVINLLGGWWFIRRFILKPVSVLNNAAMGLAQGKMDTRVAAPGGDELGRLGSTFNQMAKNLHKNTQQLQEQQEFLQALVDAIPDGIRIIDQNYSMLLENKAFRHQTGDANRTWIGEMCYKAAHNRDAPCPSTLSTCPLEEIRRTGKSLKVIHHHTDCDEKVLNVEIYAAPMLIERNGKQEMLMVESIRDLTKEVRFTHEQRLSELGRLAAGVAHEIFNPLSSVKLAMHSLQVNIQENGNDAAHDDLKIIARQVDQCIHVTDRLLRLSTSPSEEKELVDIAEVVDDTLSLVRWEAERTSIVIKKVMTEELLRVIASSSDIRMLVLNLVQNAFHAMPDGGELVIEGKKADGCIVMHVQDTGVGIMAEDLAYIFMPFFSRRADGMHGTGLGLSIAKAIVENCNGSLEVESSPGLGSCFTVTLPDAEMELLQ